MRNRRTTDSVSKRSPSSSVNQRAICELLEQRQLLSSTIESVNGSGNNTNNVNWGSAGSDLIRLAAAAYANGINSPALSADQSARVISNLVNDQAYASNRSQDLATVDRSSVSDYGYVFGQFIDHDLDLTPDGGAYLPIAVAANDPIGPGALPFTRSLTDPATGTSTSNPAQQITTVTSYLDLSQVYGSSQTVSDALRTFSNGMLKTSAGNMLPYDNLTYFTQAQITALNMSNDSGALPQSQLFAAGDVRANENTELTALETLFVRNHNSIAGYLQKEHPAWTDEQLYQEARKLNIAEYQGIVYNGWIPAILGTNAMPAYTGYNATVNATISNEFSTVAFRFGHSLISPEIARDGSDGQSVAGEIPLQYDFDDSNLLSPSGAIDPLTGLASTDIGAVLKGTADGDEQAMDISIVSAIRNVLFGNGGNGGDDLIARDVQRGRDNGIPDYNTLRKAMGLSAVTSFAQITSNVAVQNELKTAYPGGVNTIDAIEGGMAEDLVSGSDVGPLFKAIMVNQFARLRTGDRFFYGNESFNSDEANILGQRSTLAAVIIANTTITNLQADVFHFKNSISGTVSFGSSNAILGFLPPPPVAGLTLRLEDMSGNILATTKTNALGAYTFNQLSGPSADPTSNYGISATGIYQIVAVLPSTMKLLNTSPAVVKVSAGDTNVTNVNFGVSFFSGIFSNAPLFGSSLNSLNQLLAQIL